MKVGKGGNPEETGEKERNICEYVFPLVFLEHVPEAL